MIKYFYKRNNKNYMWTCAAVYLSCLAIVTADIVNGVTLKRAIDTGLYGIAFLAACSVATSIFTYRCEK